MHAPLPRQSVMTSGLISLLGSVELILNQLDIFMQVLDFVASVTRARSLRTGARPAGAKAYQMRRCVLGYALVRLPYELADLGCEW